MLLFNKLISIAATVYTKQNAARRTVTLHPCRAKKKIAAKPLNLRIFLNK